MPDFDKPDKQAALEQLTEENDKKATRQGKRITASLFCQRR
jgi:hypothetical protein